MATVRQRTKFAILVILNFIVNAQCDSEVNPNANYNIEEEKADLLLRGSGEIIDEETSRKNQLETDNFKPIDNLESSDDITNLTKDIDLSTTTETVLITTEEVHHEVKNADDDKDDEEYYDDGKGEAAEESTMVTEVSDVTETMSMDNNVYGQEDIYNISGSSSVDWIKGDLSSTTTTTENLDDVEAPVKNSSEDEVDSSGQRAPKTENTDPNQADKLNNVEMKLAPPPAISKSSTLKNWLEDAWLRPPAGILVPLRPMALNRALAVWNDLTAEGLNITDIVIVGYDNNGVNWRSRHNLQPTGSNSGQRTVAEAFSKLLLKYQDVNTEGEDGTMRALTSAAKLVPYDSALFVVTDKGAGDPQRLPLALRALVEKRLKVYTIWTDPDHPSEESEKKLQDLRNVSHHTEGDVLPYSLQVMDMESSSDMSSDRQWEPVDLQGPRKGRLNSIMEDDLDTLLVQRGGGEAISLGVPVENGVSALRIYIEGLVEHAVLYPPNDAPQIDLYNVTSVHAFSPASRTDSMSPRDVYLVFPGADLDVDMLSVLPVSQTSNDTPAPTVGMWHLSVRCDTCDYRLCVTARTHIHFHAGVEDQESNMLKIRVIGPVASVRESLLVDEYGTELAKLPFSYQPITANGKEVASETPAELLADVALPMFQGARVYAKIVGRDVQGEPFVRLAGPLNQQDVRMGRSASISFPDSTNDLERAEYDSSRIYSQQLLYNDSNTLPYNRAISQVVNQRGSLLTTVQIGLSTRLYGAPGDTLQLHFEVTNYREQSVRFSFEAVGELRFLRGISPTSQLIASGQTANVIVTVTITATAQPGARDLITFTAYGLEQVSISAYVYVMNTGQQATDVWPPDLRHNFQGSCIGRLGSDCAQYVWSATVIARDAIGGLLRLSSSPIGLVYDSNFISGSREEVIATYRATCCAPRVMVTAVDAFGNANSYVVDISNYFTEAGIAAIVLGVFLLLAIIFIIIFLIYWCVKRRKESRELPYTTSTRNIS